jgi:hypothetical protein
MPDKCIENISIYSGGHSSKNPDIVHQGRLPDSKRSLQNPPPDKGPCYVAGSDLLIVMTAAGDPLGSGLVASLARPGGNITGMSLMAPDLGGKRLELLMELLPQLSRVGILWNATTPHSSSRRRGTQLKRFELNTNLSRCEILMILILPLQLRHSSV